MDLDKNLNGQIIWNSDCNGLSVGQKLYNLNKYYEYKFKLLGEELIENSNELGTECIIDINIRYENREDKHVS